MARKLYNFIWVALEEQEQTFVGALQIGFTITTLKKTTPGGIQYPALLPPLVNQRKQDERKAADRHEQDARKAHPVPENTQTRHFGGFLVGGHDKQCSGWRRKRNREILSFGDRTRAAVGGGPGPPRVESESAIS